MESTINNEDKLACCKEGLRYEFIFVETVNAVYSNEFKLAINPKKVNNKWDNDLIVTGHTGHVEIGELKCERTPFRNIDNSTEETAKYIKANGLEESFKELDLPVPIDEDRFTISSNFGEEWHNAFAINGKDIYYYRDRPDLLIFIWVSWHKSFCVGRTLCEPRDCINGFYSVRFSELLEIVRKKPCMHFLKNRSFESSPGNNILMTDEGNARFSYYVDIRELGIKRDLPWPGDGIVRIANEKYEAYLNA